MEPVIYVETTNFQDLLKLYKNVVAKCKNYEYIFAHKNREIDGLHDLLKRQKNSKYDPDQKDLKMYIKALINDMQYHPDSPIYEIKKIVEDMHYAPGFRKMKEAEQDFNYIKDKVSL